MTATDAPLLLVVGDIARRLNCSTRQVQRLAKNGLMPPGHKLVGLRRWRADEIDAWIVEGFPPVATPAPDTN